MVFRRLTADTIIILSITVTIPHHCLSFHNFSTAKNIVILLGVEIFTPANRRNYGTFCRVSYNKRTLVGYYAIETNALFIFFLHTFRC